MTLQPPPGFVFYCTHHNIHGNIHLIITITLFVIALRAAHTRTHPILYKLHYNRKRISHLEISVYIIQLQLDMSFANADAEMYSCYALNRDNTANCTVTPRAFHRFQPDPIRSNTHQFICALGNLSKPYTTTTQYVASINTPLQHLRRTHPLHLTDYY